MNMKTNKLKLNDLKVDSFVTALNEKNAKTVQGGGYTQPKCFSFTCFAFSICICD